MVVPPGEGTVAAAECVSLPPPFLGKTYTIVNDPTTDEVVSWSESGDSFVIWNPERFTEEILPNYFRHKNFKTFTRQLNIYRFRKVDPLLWEFKNARFLRGQKHLLKTIRRNKAPHAQGHQQPAPVQNPSVGSSIGAGKSPMEEVVETFSGEESAFVTHEISMLKQQQQSVNQDVVALKQQIQLIIEQNNRIHSEFVAYKSMRRLPCKCNANRFSVHDHMDPPSSGIPGGILPEAAFRASTSTLPVIQSASGTGAPDFIPIEGITPERKTNHLYDEPPFMGAQNTNSGFGDADPFPFDDIHNLQGMEGFSGAPSLLSYNSLADEIDAVTNLGHVGTSNNEQQVVNNMNNLTDEMGALASSPKDPTL